MILRTSEICDQCYKQRAAAAGGRARSQSPAWPRRFDTGDHGITVHVNSNEEKRLLQLKNIFLKRTAKALPQFLLEEEQKKKR
jgi:hypothetical protein